MRRALLLGASLLMGGCAWGPGQGFAVIEPTVRAAYAPVAGRAAGDGYEWLSTDYQVRVDEASLQLSGITLQASASGGGSFDPANPPPGYSLCHGGHCHRDDGALIDYADIAAELGGGGGPSTVVTLSTPDPLALLAPETRPLTCAPDCALPEAQVSRSNWTVRTLRLSGIIRDGRVPARFSGERRFVVSLTPSATASSVAAMGGSLTLASDRVTPPETRLALNVTLTAALFDGMDWEALVLNKTVVDFNDDQSKAARALFLEHLSQISPTAEVTHGR